MGTLFFNELNYTFKPLRALFAMYFDDICQIWILTQLEQNTVTV